MTHLDARAAQPPALDGVTDYRIIGRPRPLMWVATAVVIALAAMVLHSIVTNPRFEWDVVATYFFSTSVLNGLWKTIELTVVSMVIGIVIGLVIALMRISSSRVLNAVAGVYVWFFRGTPLLVQLVLLYNISALYPSISIGIPFGPTFFEGSVNQIVTPYVVAVAALALNEAAYMAEIIRGGLLSVDHGQLEASRALGMSGSRAMRRIVLPQAMRFIIPPTGNEVLSLLKSTSLVSVIALPELLYSVQVVYSRTFETIPLLMVATIWYLIVTSILMVGQQLLERFYARGSSRASGAGSLQRLTGIRFRRRATSATQTGEQR
ncbi:amino acid ABC transporter permease [Microbacterium sp. zg-B185]|uniref:amino acid ABC transporter permease n=1 Tax=Microbacterium sp. zg-B185 TaxID=3049070 RepID=UPI00254AB49C|nr:amino acid ABC transporter permease [Microbacterium sp. zg-B185]WIM18562.1 amino acid ABC transporter permease [Microbacterium sp. zg-B185]